MKAGMDLFIEKLGDFLCGLGSTWTIQSMEFSRQEYWSGLLFPFPGDLPDLGTQVPRITGGFFTAEPPGKPIETTGGG